MESKDLTALTELPLTSPTTEGAASGVSEDAFPETPVETLQEFESLDSISTHPEPQAEAAAEAVSDVAADIAATVEPALTPDQAPSDAVPTSDSGTPMPELKRFSEQAAISRVSVPAAFPFSLSITGHLSASEKEKLLELLSTHNMGFREVDLEPQFESGRILLPRISEYAGILLAQALRGSKTRIRLGPSDSIFSSDDTRADSNETLPTSMHTTNAQASADLSHPAESLPLTQDSTLPGKPQLEIIDVVTASASIKSRVVEMETSSEYQEILEALQREIKYKAFRKGATAIVGYSIQLVSLSMPTHYRLTVMGSAVKTRT